MASERASRTGVANVDDHVLQHPQAQQGHKRIKKKMKYFVLKMNIKIIFTLQTSFLFFDLKKKLIKHSIFFK